MVDGARAHDEAGARRAHDGIGLRQAYAERAFRGFTAPHRTQKEDPRVRLSNQAIQRAFLVAALTACASSETAESPSDASSDGADADETLRVDGDAMPDVRADDALDSASDVVDDVGDGSDVLDSPLDPDRPLEVAVGYFEHACARTASGYVRCWGSDDFGCLGYGVASGPRPTPGPPLPGLDHVIRIAAGNSETCAIRDDHSVWCWGQGTDGLLADGKLPGPDAVAVPTKVAAIDDAIDIAVGGGFVSVIRSDHTLWTWGKGTEDMLGYPTTTPCDPSLDSNTCSATPRQVADVGAVDRVAFGAMHTCVVRQADSSVWCWGSNGAGELGDGTTTSRWKPMRVPGLDPVSAISLGGAQSTALTKTGDVYRWGTMEPSSPPQTIPTIVSGFSGSVATTEVGFYTSCAIIAGPGTLDCWWIQIVGPPGTPAPVAFPPTAIPLQSMASSGFACAIGSDHAIYCFGDADYLGDGSASVSSPTPVRVVW